MRKQTLAALLLGCSVSLIAPPRALADLASDAQKQLAGFEAEVQQLDKNITKPTLKTKPAATLSGQLIDAQVAFATQRYDEAAMILFDYVGQAQKPRDIDIALYYLAESLHQKGDRVAARTYFAQLARDHSGSKYHAQALERLVSLAIQLDDKTGAEQWLTAMNAHASGPRKSSIAYVRGKYAAYDKKPDDALNFFSQVTDGAHEFQAQFFAATVHIDKKDLGRATDVLEALVKKKPKNAVDRRVLEVSQLALARLYYERDQPSKAVDNYLMIDRHSDLFDSALYEAAWVYVKGKQFDKALRALELLALTDPLSSKTPTVRILEGNLRIRKAQMIKNRLDMGAKVESTPAQEYDKATQIFTETHATYLPAHDELVKILEAKTDPELYMAQIGGRTSKTFEQNAEMPEVGAAFVRQEPEVERVVAIESDLAEIQDNLAEAERTIVRIEAALVSTNRVNLFPSLAEKRNRGAEIQEKLAKLQIQLLDEQHKMASSDPAVDAATDARKQAQAEAAALPNAEAEYAARIEAARAEWDKVDAQASEVQVAIESTDAGRAALSKYRTDSADKLSTIQKSELDKELPAMVPEIAAMRKELDEIRAEIEAGRDEAGGGDEVARKARDTRKKLRDAIDAEQKALSKVLSPSGRSLEAASQKAQIIGDQIDKMNEQIDRLVDESLVDVKATVKQERGELNAMRREFLSYEAESRALGGNVLGQAFKDVKMKFYEILVRADVGIVDVAWSQKEDIDGDLEKLRVQRSREIKQLRDEFRDLLEEQAQPTPAPPTTPAPPPGTEPAPTPAPTPPASGGGQ
jgi:hypothetical protein